MGSQSLHECRLLYCAQKLTVAEGMSWRLYLSIQVTNKLQVCTRLYAKSVCEVRNFVFISVYDKNHVERTTCILVLFICVVRKISLCFHHLCCTMPSVRRYQRFVSTCYFLLQGVSFHSPKHCVRLHCIIPHKTVFRASNVTSCRLVYIIVGYATTNDATTNECYNEQFLSIKSECYNERGILSSDTRVRLTCSVVVFTRERLFVLFMCFRLFVLFIRERLFIVFTKERLFLLFKFTCTAYKS
jgi:hypothetical protein